MQISVSGLNIDNKAASRRKARPHRRRVNLNSVNIHLKKGESNNLQEINLRLCYSRFVSVKQWAQGQVGSLFLVALPPELLLQAVDPPLWRKGTSRQRHN